MKAQENFRGQVLSARQGYNLVSKYYEHWYWYPFWRANEGPLIRKWLGTTKGIGLDAGCGNAPYLLDLAHSLHRTILMDFSDGMLEHAAKRIKKASKQHPAMTRKISVVQADINNIPLSDGRIGFILCSRVLSNIRTLESTIAEFSRVLAPSGKLMLTDVHPSHNYQYTGIDIDGARVNIETYKHDIPKIIECAQAVGLVLEHANVYSLLNLAKQPDPARFAKLYREPTKPIFFTLNFVRSGSIAK